MKLARQLMALSAFVVLAGCAGGSVVLGDPEPPREPPRGQRLNVKIPPGHMPPPGKCRIWYPGRPPGQQPPPGECSELRHRVPRNAVLVQG